MRKKQKTKPFFFILFFKNLFYVKIKPQKAKPHIHQNQITQRTEQTQKNKQGITLDLQEGRKEQEIIIIII